MKNTSKKIVFFGNERLSSGFEPQGAPTLQALITAGYNIVAVVANHQEATSRKARKLEIQAVAEAHNIPLLLPRNLVAIRDELIALQPNVGVLVAYGRMVPQTVIDVFPHGIVNIHPSLLPQYRGSTPIEQAILDGVKQTGVSLMQLVKKMDAGPIFAQETLVLDGHETKFELTTTMLNIGSQMLIKSLPGIVNGSLQAMMQNDKNATYCGLITKANGILDLAKPALQLEREVRAYAGWPKSRVTIFEQDIVVTKARVVASLVDSTLTLTCGQRSYLEILELTAPSGRRMSGSDFMRGYKKS